MNLLLARLRRRARIWIRCLRVVGRDFSGHGDEALMRRYGWIDPD